MAVEMGMDAVMENGDESMNSLQGMSENQEPIVNGVNELNGDGEHQNGSNMTNHTTMSNGDSNQQQDDPDNIPWAQRIRDKQQDKGNDEVPDDNIPWAQRMRKNKTDNGIDQSSTVMEVESTETTHSSKGTETTRSSKRISTTATTSSTSQKSRKSKAAESSDEEEEYKPEKKKSKKEISSTKKVKKEVKYEEEEEEDEAPTSSHKKKKTTKVEVKEEGPVKKRKKVVEEEEVWKWWEEEQVTEKDLTVKWTKLEHKGPMFAPEYVPIPNTVKFKYDGKPIQLSKDAEEVASFYAKMLDHDYTSKPVFNKNFFKDWRRVMKPEEREKITDLKKCDFSEMHAYFLSETEKRKARSKEEKKAEKEVKDQEAKEYGYASLDGYKQKIGNFRIEPPGLFRGRGEHPKMGCLKKRVRPEDVVINCSPGVKIPPPKGHKWKEIRHDNTVTWLCSWTENVLGSNKYIMLNPSSKLKGQKDWEKFEKARKLKGLVGPIRDQYVIDFKSKEMRIRQRAVALYFIDKLALRAGNEKDTEEAADTVGCCSLRCEHIKLHDEMDGQKYVVEFDFLGKDSIRYYNRVPVEKAVFKNLKIFMESKEPGDDLFDRLDTSSLNIYLKELMDGLTAKVFRTYNASITLQEQLDKLTNPDDSVHEKLLSYNRANRQVAILCNHQRAIPKTHEKSMENLENKIKEKKKEYKEIKAELKKKKSDEKLQKKYMRVKEQLEKLKTQRTDKDENKQIALGTSKLNYLDPRITVAWCKKYEVPIEKIFSKTHRDKFRWAIDMTKEDFIF